MDLLCFLPAERYAPPRLPYSGSLGRRFPTFPAGASCAPPSVICSAKTAASPSRVASLSLATRYLDCYPCFVSPVSGSPAAGSPSTDARTLLTRSPHLLSQYPGICQGDQRLSQVPELPLCVHAPLSDPGGVPQTGLDVCGTAAFRSRDDVGFLPLLRDYPLTTIIGISGFNNAACTLATPGTGLPLRGLPAGSLLTCLLGFGQVGLTPTGQRSTHFIGSSPNP